MEIEYHDPSIMTIINSRDIVNLLRKQNIEIDPIKVIKGISYDITNISQFSNKSLACVSTPITNPTNTVNILNRAEKIIKEEN